MNIEFELDEFIKAELNTGALLITGKWGCGKTHFIKNFAQKYNQNKKYAVAVISLFGIDNIKDFNERIKEEYLAFLTILFGKKTKKMFKPIEKMVRAISKMTTAALPSSAVASAVYAGIESARSFNPLGFWSVKKEIGLGQNKKEFILVLDDFERQGIKCRDLIGAINEYVENKEIKTIIIANEEKIEDDDYTEMKEKLISRTIKFSANNIETLESILNDYPEDKDGYKEFLMQYKEYLVEAFSDSEYNNLRTFKVCLADFKRVYLAWKESEVPFEGNIENVLYAFCAITYESRAGYYTEKEDIGYGIVVGEENQEKEIEAKYISDTFQYIWESISRWVVKGDWNKDDFIAEIRKKYIKEELSHEWLFVNSHFWDLQQEDIDEGMPPLIAKAYEGEASCDELISLLHKIHCIKEYKISLPCDVDYSKIKEGFEKRKQKIKRGIIEEPPKYTFISNSQIDEEAYELNMEIENLDYKMRAWENQQLFKKYLLDSEGIHRYDLKNKYLESFDDELLNLFIKTYNTSKNGKKSELILVLNGFVFDSSQYSSYEQQNTTIKNLKVLLQRIQNQNNKSSDNMSVAVDRSAAEAIEEIINRLEKKDTVS